MEAVKKNSEPWLGAGDFNVIASANEHSGRAPPNVRNIEEFNDVVFNCGLSPVSFDGQPFTWMNGKVWQRLDCALVNCARSNLFGISKVFHLVRGRSDHAPLLIRCGYMGDRGKSFRYLNM